MKRVCFQIFAVIEKVYPLIEHKTWFILNSHQSPLTGRPVAVLAEKFQPYSPLNSSQYRCINRAFAEEVYTKKHSVNSHWEHSVISLFTHLSGQLLKGGTSICPNGSPQPSFASIIYARSEQHLSHFWFSVVSFWRALYTFTTAECKEFTKILHLRNASTFGQKAKHHVFLDRSISALRRRLQCFPIYRHTLCVLYFSVLTSLLLFFTSCWSRK